MSVYLFQRLLTEGSLAPPVLLEAFERSQRTNSAFIEALIGADVRYAYTVASCFAADGEKADKAWRPDPRLLLDLPPGLCERHLAFPFRERAGAVEVATVSPLDLAVHQEFTFHLRRPIALFRGNLQALLAAAGASVDLGALPYSLSEPPPVAETSPIPLVRKSQRKPNARPRTQTAPGIGEQNSSSFPPSDPYAGEVAPPSPWGVGHTSSLDLLNESRDERELAHALSLLLVGPYLILQIVEDEIVPRVSSGAVPPSPDPIARWEETVFCVAADQGKYLGPWSPNPIHSRFRGLFNEGDLVRAERVGGLESGLVVVQKVAFDGSDDGEVLDQARAAWVRIQERATLFG